MTARWLYQNLPDQLRIQIAIFLNFEEIKSLTQKVSKKVTAKKVSPQKGTGALYKIFTIAIFLQLILSIIETNIEGIAFAFGYTLITLSALYRRSYLYWDMMFWKFPFRPADFVLANLCYMVLMLMLGLLTIDIQPQSPESSLMLAAGFIGPFVEELLFRDLMFSGQKPIITGFFSSVAFSLAHATMESFTFHFFGVYFFAGMILFLLRWYSKNLLYPFLVHISVNITLLII